MTEWTVVTVVIALTGLVLTVVRPVVNLNTSITKLTDAVSTLQENLKEFMTRNADSHDKLWKHNDSQDTVLSDHETRLQIIEKTSKGG
jgi:predicted  nucleic acid-binding Zn-ribbon protein